MEQTNEEKFNLLYENLKKTIELHTMLPLQVYNLNNLKNYDKNKILFTEKRLKIVSAILNHYIKYYINSVNSEIQVFLDKYNLSSILQNRTKCFIYEKLMNEMGMSVKELENLINIISLPDDDNALMNYYITNFLLENNKCLENENRILRDELQTLKNKKD